MRDPRQLPTDDPRVLAFVDALAAGVARSVLEEIRGGNGAAAVNQAPKMRVRASGQETRTLAETQDAARILHGPP